MTLKKSFLDVLLTWAEQSNYLFVKAETYKECFESRWLWGCIISGPSQPYQSVHIMLGSHATSATWCILRSGQLKMAGDGYDAAGLMPFWWCQLVQLASRWGSQINCSGYLVTLHQCGRSSNEREWRILAPNIVSSSFVGWVGVSAYNGCGWLVILILFMACDICHRPSPTLCVWFEPSFHDCRPHPKILHPCECCSRLETRKSIGLSSIFVWSWAGQHHPSQIQVHWGERERGSICNISLFISG